MRKIRTKEKCSLLDIHKYSKSILSSVRKTKNDKFKATLYL